MTTTPAPAPAVPHGAWDSFKAIMRPRLREWKYGIYRLRQSLLAMMGLAVVSFGVVVGTILGGVAGYFGGRVDEVIMRVTDVFLAMPLLILAMGVTVALGRGLVNIGIALAVTWWPTYTRLVRGQVLSIRENQYVEAARSVGASD